MSIEYCHKCDKPIDTDFDVDHFIEHDYETAYNTLSKIHPKIKDMKYPEFRDWAEDATFEDLCKEVN